MTQLTRNAQVLRYLLDVAPGLGHTKLAKFAYLADLEARRYLGRPVSHFRYVLDRHGPFDARNFFSARDELVAGGLATEAQVEVGGYPGFELRPTATGIEYDFTLAEAEVLRHVARTYFEMTAKSLCDDIVYETEPMKKKGLKLGERLSMDDMNRKKDELDFDLERMIAGEESARAGRTRPLAEALRELRTRDC